MKESIYYSKHSAQIQVMPPLLKIRLGEQMQQLLVTTIPTFSTHA